MRRQPVPPTFHSTSTAKRTHPCQPTKTAYVASVPADSITSGVKMRFAHAAALSDSLASAKTQGAKSAAPKWSTLERTTKRHITNAQRAGPSNEETDLDGSFGVQLARPVARQSFGQWALNSLSSELVPGGT